MSNLKLWGEVPEGFDVQRIGQISSVQTGPFGSQLHKEDYVDVGTPIVTVEHLGENFFTHQNLPRVSEQDVERLSKYKLRAGDIVFSRVGSVERRSLVRNSEDGWLFSGRCLRIRPNPEVVCSTYLSYFLGHPGVRDYIRAIAVGATMPSLNTKLLSDIPVYLPPLPEQRRVGELLGMLDEKIELNRQTARTLEELTQRLFKSWFVDFDPVRAKMAGRQPAHTPPEIADLFPDRLVDSPLGPIPEGWVFQSLSDVADVRIGRTPPRKEGWWFSYDPHDNPWASIRDMGAEGAFLEETSEFLTPEAIAKHRMKLAREGSILYSFKMTVGRVKIAGEPMATNEAIAQVDPQSGPLGTSYLYLALLNGPDLALESTSSIAVATNSKGVKKIPILCPSTATHRAFEDITRDIFRRLNALQRENKTLAQLRDRLLPKLISGEIRVPEAQEMAEESIS